MFQFDFLGTKDFCSSDVNRFIEISEKNKISKALLFRTLLDIIDDDEEWPSIEVSKKNSEGTKRIFEIEGDYLTYGQVLKKMDFIAFRQVLTKASEDSEKRDLGGFVYVILSEDKIKIGRSLDVKQRVKAIQSMSASEVKLIDSIYFKNYCKAENIVHKKFKDNRLHGEWFDSSILDKVLKFLKKLSEEA